MSSVESAEPGRCRQRGALMVGGFDIISKTFTASA